MKLSTNHGWNMGELHAKFHQNWWSGFRDILLPNTDGHSFIIIRIYSPFLNAVEMIFIKFDRSKKLGTYLHLHVCFSFAHLLKKKRMWKCIITEELGWKKLVKILRNKQKMWKRTHLKKMWKKLDRICEEKNQRPLRGL